jgi:type IV fimbrial biogenesis protein FimT
MDVGPKTTRRTRGLTLVELITTLAVISVSLAVIVPSWAALTERSRITTTANGLLADLRYARGEAVFQHFAVSLCPSADGATCSGDPKGWQFGYLVFVDTNNNRKRESGERLLRVAPTRPNGLELHSTSGRPAVRFFPDGAAWGTNTTFSVCAGDGGGNRAVILHGAGRARIDDKTPSGDAVSCS